jgi:hypothetical protein
MGVDEDIGFEDFLNGRASEFSFNLNVVDPFESENNVDFHQVMESRLGMN